MIEAGGRGGVTDYTVELARALAADGRPVTLATATDHEVDAPPGVTVLGRFAYLRETGRVTRLLRRARLHKAFNGIAFLAAILAILPQARRSDVVHLQGFEVPPLTVLAMLLLRIAGTPLVHTPHNTFERGSSMARTRALMHRLPARTVVHARADLANLPARARSRTVVIPHGEYGPLADAGGPADRAEARRALGIPQDAPSVLCFGQLRPDKGIDDVLAAVAGIPDMHVVVAGQDLGALAAAADELTRLGDRAHVRAGFQTLEQAAEMFAAADAAVMAYRHASASGVLLLSYGFSVPVVVYPVGGLPESVEDGVTGWVCARADRAALGDALRDVVTAGAGGCAQRGAAGRAMSHERYAWSVIAASTGRAYDDLRVAAAPG